MMELTEKNKMLQEQINSLDEMISQRGIDNTMLRVKTKSQQEQINRFADKVIKQQEEIESLKSQLVDAQGDGFYDGYLKCVEHAKEDSFDSYAINESYILKLSEQYESDHNYAKSIAEIKASALDDLYNELAEIPYVGVNATFLKQRAKAIRDSADKAKGGTA